jgi:uncharacterized protein YfbU (UPF0304 family)
MGQLTITLSDESEQKVRNYAIKNGYDSVSDFVREVTSQATSGRPNYWERTYLAHLMEIERLQGADINEELLDALKSGYSKFYSLAEYSVSRDEMKEDDMEFVMQVLEMYAQLQYSYRESSEKDPKIKEQVLFPGFDGNESNGHFGFLHFLVTHGKYSYVKPLDKGHAINSHMPVTGIYRRMLDEYKTIKRDSYEHRPLTLAEIKRVLAARIHPENRKKID